jgi:hypothetical protein
MTEDDNEVVNLQEGERQYFRIQHLNGIQQALANDPRLREQVYAWLRTLNPQITKY